MKLPRVSHKSFLCLMLFAISMMSNAGVTFKASYNGSAISSFKIYLYRNGVQHSYLSGSSKTSFVFSTDEGQYTYLTNKNHKGTVQDGETITLQTGKFCYTITDNDGVPISSVRVSVYEDGNKVDDIYTDANGNAEFYLAEGDKYAYKTDYSSGSFTILSNKETVIEDCVSTITVMAKYQDVPVAGYYYLVPAESNVSLSSGYISSSYPATGQMRFTCKHGESYRIKNDYDVYSQTFIPTADNNSFSIEHHKVTFISNSDDPNILADFEVLGYGQNYSKSSANKISDGKGYAVYYLMPGKYKYVHFGAVKAFDVVDQDITITLNSKAKEIILKKPSGETAPSGQKVTICSSFSSRDILSDASGIVTFQSLENDEYIKVNGLGRLPVPNSGNLEVELTELVFEDPRFNNDRVTLTDGERSVTMYNGDNIWVIKDCQYKYNIYYDDGRYIDNVVINTAACPAEIGSELNAVSFAARTRSGMPMSGLTIYAYTNGSLRTSRRTDSNGKCILYLESGFYEFKDSSTNNVIITASIESDKDIEYVGNDEVTVNVYVDDKPYNGYVIFTSENGELVNVSCSDGIGKGRLEAGRRYEVRIGSMSQICKVDVFDGMSLDCYETLISSEGNGLAFPVISYYYENTSTKMLKGENLHLVAVPAANAQFKHWLINGTEYKSAVVDYKVEGPIKAVAVFDSSESSGIADSFASYGNLNVSTKDNYLVFDRDISGNVDVFNLSGVKIKSAYVVSDRIDISDLADGVYIVALTESSFIYSSKFVKSSNDKSNIF